MTAGELPAPLYHLQGEQHSVTEAVHLKCWQGAWKRQNMF